MSQVPLDELVSWWKLDEASGTRYDAHADNDLTQNGGPVWNTTDYKYVASMDCEASSDQYAYITQANQTGLSFGNEDFTWGAWWRAESIAGGNLQLYRRQMQGLFR